MENVNYSELQAENDRLRKQVAEMQRPKNEEFINGLISQGKFAPVAKEKALNLLNYAYSIDQGETLDFAEGETLLQKMQDFLNSQPKIVYFGEYATKERAIETDTMGSVVEYHEETPPELIELDQQIRAYARANSTDYKTALNIITKGA